MAFEVVLCRLDQQGAVKKQKQPERQKRPGGSSCWCLSKHFEIYCISQFLNIMIVLSQNSTSECSSWTPPPNGSCRGQQQVYCNL